MRFIVVVAAGLVMYALLLVGEKMWFKKTWTEILNPSPGLFIVNLVIAVVVSNLVVDMLVLRN